MTVKEWLKNKILRFLGIEHLSENPNSQRLTFISDNDDIIMAEIMENKTWYIGNSSELLNLYTGQEVFGYYKNPLYNRNSRFLFWGLSSSECDIKRIHCGIPNAIITTLVNAIGYPDISVNNSAAISLDAIEQNKKLNDKLLNILDKNSFKNKYNQEQMPLTMVEASGAWKIDIDPDFADYPILQYYEAENVEFYEKYGKVIGIVYKDYYKKDNKDYIKFEIRRIDKNKDSVIEHELYRLGKNNDLIKCDLSDIPELADLKPLRIPGLNRILGVPCKFFHNPIYPTRGRSIFSGKIEMFDLLDEIWSQLSQTNRVSTPVEYYPVDTLERTKNGVAVLPTRYNRQFIKKEGVPDGDGNTDGKIETTQPQLNYNQYIEAFRATLDCILTGMLSPATMGIDVAKKDNADAQREKEKVTTMTALNIEDSEEKVIKELCTLLLMVQEYIDTGKITITDYDIVVKYKDIATPSFNQNLQILGAARQMGNISNKMYVDLLWGDTLTEEQKEEEIKRLEEKEKSDNFNLNGMFNNDSTEDSTGEDLQE